MRSRIVRQKNKLAAVLLQLSVLTLLLSVSAAVAQTNESTSINTTTSTSQSTSNQPPSNGALDSTPNPYDEIKKT